MRQTDSRWSLIQRGVTISRLLEQSIIIGIHYQASTKVE